MADLDGQVAALKKRIAEAQRDRARREQALASAQAQADYARAQLHERFGVDTVDAARIKHADLTNDLTSVLADLQQALDDIGA